MSTEESPESMKTALQLDPWWIAGFVDGEGCFSISFIKNETTRFGYQIFVEFVVTQGEKSLEALESIQDYYSCGMLYCNRRKDNHQENLFRYCVRNRKDLQNTIIPFFRQYSLKTTKSNDFEVFALVVDMMDKGEHLTEEGFIKIQQLAATTNRKKLRTRAKIR